jgi:hypothetical protein
MGASSPLHASFGNTNVPLSLRPRRIRVAQSKKKRLNQDYSKSGAHNARTRSVPANKH